jgi:hypothetical protein
VDLKFAEYGAAAKVKQMESHFSLLNFTGTGTDFTSGGTTSFHLQPKVAATDSHRRLSFFGMRTEIGDASERSCVPRRVASCKSSLASRYIPEEAPGSNASNGVSNFSPDDGLSW